jgi:hypothetical protein
LCSSQVNVVFEGEYFGFGVEVSDPGGFNAAGGNAQGNILSALHYVHVGGGKARGPRHTGVV